MVRRILFSTILIWMFLIPVFGYSTDARNIAFVEKTELFEESIFLANVYDEESEIFDLINKERRKYRLNGLEWNDRLAKIARNYSKKMARESFFGHFDQDGKSVTDRVIDGKISNWKKVGENLFYCQNLNNYSPFAVKGWMKSPSHRRNILDRNYTATGIGIAESRSGEIYITQVFIQE